MRNPAAAPSPLSFPDGYHYVNFVRVSGEAQAARNTPADQRNALTKLGKRMPGVLVEWIDDGAAGLSGRLPLLERPDLQRLFSLLSGRLVNEVRVRFLNRLTRSLDVRDRAAIFGAVADVGGRFVDCAGTVIDTRESWAEMAFMMGTKQAAEEVSRLVALSKESKTRLAGEGILMGHPPYGRSWDRRAPEGQRWGFTPEAETYRRLYREILAGKSANQLARDLTAERVPTPGTFWMSKPADAPWTPTGIIKLLRNPAALGEVHSHGHVIRCEPLVDEVTFRRAEECLTKLRRAGSPAGRSGREALLRGLLTCFHCGAPVWVTLNGRTRGSGRTLQDYYICSRKETEGAADPQCRSWKEHMVRDVDEDLKRQLLEWAKGRTAKLAEAQRAERQDPKETLRRAAATLRRLETREKALLEFVMDNPKLRAAAQERGNELARERREVELLIARTKTATEAAAAAAAAVTDGEKEIAKIRHEMRLDRPFAWWRGAVELLLPRGSAEIKPDGHLVLHPLRDPYPRRTP